ncbi:MAG: DUF5908 family protein [Anaerolineae bacterium]
MPVEIKELVIRAVTDLEGPPEVRASSEDMEAIIQACVKQVLRILKKKKER